jgi:hypothetical protein
MEIKSISNDPSFFVNAQTAQKPENMQQESKDKIEISNEGRTIATSELSTQRLEEIRERIQSNFYSSEEVLNKVAEKILGDLNK